MTDRVLKKLKLSMDNGDFYAAHQMYLTVHTRYAKEKQYDKATELLSSGIPRLIENKQYGSALDLATVLLKMWSEQPEDGLNEQKLTLVFEFLDAMPVDAKEFDDLVRVAVKWTCKCSEIPGGEPMLHHQVGVIYANAGKYAEAREHFIRGPVDSAESLAVMMLKRGMEEGLPMEQVASMVVVPTLQYLGMLKIANALTFFKTFSTQMETVEPSTKQTTVATPCTASNQVNVFSHSVLNFAQLVILSAQRGPAAARGYMALCQQYITRNIPEEDPIHELLERVGEKVFSIRPRQAQQPNMLQNLLSSLMVGGSN